MMSAQFSLDLIEELERTLPSYHLYVPSPVMYELEKIKKRSKGKNKIAASIALKIAKSPPFKLRKESQLFTYANDDTWLWMDILTFNLSGNTAKMNISV